MIVYDEPEVIMNAIINAGYIEEFIGDFMMDIQDAITVVMERPGDHYIEIFSLLSACGDVGNNKWMARNVLEFLLGISNLSEYMDTWLVERIAIEKRNGRT